MSQPLRVLFVEDLDDDAVLACHALRKGGFTPISKRVQTAHDLRAALAEVWDVVIADFKISAGFTGLDALKIVQESKLDLPFIIVSGFIGEDKAVEAMRSGAHDYIMKDTRLARLPPAIHRELRETEIRRARRLAEEKLHAENALRETIEKTIPSGIALTDLEGKITYVNPAFCRLVGWTEPNLIGSKPPYMFWPPEEANAYKEKFWSLSNNPADPAWFEWRFLRGDGTQIPVLILCTRLRDRAGAQTHWLASFTDISPQKEAEEALRQLNEQLEQRVKDRTADLNDALEKLTQAVQARKELEIELLDIVEKERGRMGLELHDDLGQRLSGMVLMSKGLELKLKNQGLSMATEAARLHANLEASINLAKGMAKKLIPWDFKSGSLVEALRRLAAQNRECFAVACSFTTSGAIPPLSPEKEMHIYKIAQEAMHNAIKHGQANKVQARLVRREKRLVLTVKNDGKQFPAVDTLKAGAGLRIMKYRAHVIGALLEIQPHPEGGTTVTCTLELE